MYFHESSLTSLDMLREIKLKILFKGEITGKKEEKWVREVDFIPHPPVIFTINKIPTQNSLTKAHIE